MLHRLRRENGQRVTDDSCRCCALALDTTGPARGYRYGTRMHIFLASRRGCHAPDQPPPHGCYIARHFAKSAAIGAFTAAMPPCVPRDLGPEHTIGGAYCAPVQAEQWRIGLPRRQKCGCNNMQQQLLAATMALQMALRSNRAEASRAERQLKELHSKAHCEAASARRPGTRMRDPRPKLEGEISRSQRQRRPRHRAPPPKAPGARAATQGTENAGRRLGTPERGQQTERRGAKAARALSEDPCARYARGRRRSRWRRLNGKPR